MSCFCRNKLPLPVPEPVSASVPSVGVDLGGKPVLGNPVLDAVSGWLAERWLPAPAWNPEPDWLELDWPDPPMPPSALAVLLGLVTAQASCLAVLSVDPAVTVDVARLARIVVTLNRRIPQLQALDEDWRPWEALATLNGQVDAVRLSLSAGLFDGTRHVDVPLAPWRTMVAQVKALAPLVAIGQLQKLDFGDPRAADTLAGTVRKLRCVALPELADPALLLRLISRMDAVARLRDSLGADPRAYPFARVQAAVERRVQETLALLPEAIRIEGGALAGMPVRQPNPGLLINAETVRMARTLTPDVLDRLRWQVPNYQDLPLLTVGATVSALVRAMASLGENPVQQQPCGTACDAGPLALQ